MLNIQWLGRDTASRRTVPTCPFSPVHQLRLLIHIDCPVFSGDVRHIFVFCASQLSFFVKIVVKRYFPKIIHHCRTKGISTTRDGIARNTKLIRVTLSYKFVAARVKFFGTMFVINIYFYITRALIKNLINKYRDFVKLVEKNCLI